MGSLLPFALLSFLLSGCNNFEFTDKTELRSGGIRSGEMAQASWDVSKGGATLARSTSDIALAPVGVTLGDSTTLDHLSSVYAAPTGNTDLEYHSETGYLILVFKEEVRIIDTKKNNDPADDELLTVYSTTTSPAIPAYTRKVRYESSSGILFLAFYGGIKLIDTNFTATISDDVDLGTYSVASGHLLSDNALDVFLSPDGLVYTSTYGHLEVIDRMGTATIADDVRLIDLTASSSPQVNGNVANRVTFSPSTNQIFISKTSAGRFTVLNTQGTRDPTDDTVNYFYNASSTPTLTAHGSVDHSYDDDSGLLIISTWDLPYLKSLIHLIDTKGTATVSDDVVLATLDHLTFGIPLHHDYDFTYDRTRKILFVATSYGLISYAIGDPSTVLDDSWSIDTKFDLMPSPWYGGIVQIPEANTLYMSTSTGILVHSPGVTQSAGQFVSGPIAIGGVRSELRSQSAGNVQIFTRTGDADVHFQTDLSSSVPSDWGDPWAWGSAASTYTNTGGVIQVTGFPANSNGFDFWFDTGKSAGFYPAGSTIKARVRANCSHAVYFYLFEDEWWTDDFIVASDNSWHDLTLKSKTPFHTVGFEVWLTEYASGKIDVNCTSVEVDSIEIIAGDSSWAPWTPLSGTTIDSDFTGAAFLQYKAFLQNDSQVPSLTEVTITGAYESTGEVISSVVFNRPRRPETLTVDQIAPAGTSMSFAFSIDGGNNWTALSGSGKTLAFPETPKVSAILIKTTLATNDERFSPVLRSLSVQGR